MNQLRYCVFLFMAVFLSGCYTSSDAAKDKAAKNMRLEEIKRKVADEVAKGPTVTEHMTQRGQILIVSIPTSAIFTVTRYECVIFRDAEFKTSSISCPPEIDPSDYSHLGEP